MNVMKGRLLPLELMLVLLLRIGMLQPVGGVLLVVVLRVLLSREVRVRMGVIGGRLLPLVLVLVVYRVRVLQRVGGWLLLLWVVMLLMPLSRYVRVRMDVMRGRLVLLVLVLVVLPDGSWGPGRGRRARAGCGQRGAFTW